MAAFNEYKEVETMEKTNKMIYYAGSYYRYENGYYKHYDDIEFKSLISLQLPTNLRTMMNVDKIFNSFKTKPGVYLKPDDSRIEPREWINFKNCLYNPYTGLTQQHTDNLIFFTQRPYDYNPTVKPHELTDDFFDNCVISYEGLEKEKAKELLYQVIGVVLSGIRPKNFVFIQGMKKDTGKSSFCGVIQRLLGNGNYSAVPIELMKEDSFNLTTMIGKPANIVTETSNVALREAQITFLKKATGGEEETIFINIKNKGVVEVKLKTFLIFAGNNIPDVWSRGNLDAFLERMIPIHFDGQVPLEKQIKGITDKLDYEYIIYNSMMALKRFIDNNNVFTLPDKVIEKRNEIKNNDPVVSFLEDCDFSDSEYVIHGKTLVDIFTKWNYDNGLGTKLTNQSFYSRLVDNGVNKLSTKKRETEGRQTPYLAFQGIKPPKEYLDNYLSGFGNMKNQVK